RLFFSSRRRHTSFSRDWSSDVCSSDLAEATSSDVLADPGKLDGLLRAVSAHTATDRDLTLDAMLSLGSTLADSDLDEISFYTVRSEERRVGKECRSRRSTCHDCTTRNA